MTNTKKMQTARHPGAETLADEYEQLLKADSNINAAKDAVRAAECQRDAHLARVGSAVRALRVALGIPASVMAGRHAIPAPQLDAYVKFEDTGYLAWKETIRDIVDRLLGEAKAKWGTDSPEGR